MRSAPVTPATETDDFADLRRADRTPGLRLLVGILVLATILASTGLYLKSLTASAAILLY